MKPTLPLLTLLAVTTLHVHSYSQAGETKIEYQKGDKIVAALELPYSPDVIQDAVKDAMVKKGCKTDRAKGFDVYRNIRLNEKDQEMSDVHCKVESKNKDASVLYLLIGRPGENIGVRTTSDRYKIDEAKSLLNHIKPTIDAYNLEVEIRNQEEVVKKWEKRLQNLEEEKQELEKKAKALQDKLEQNRLEQKTQSEETTKQKMMLTVLKQKRKY
jgi:hypothetical protein